ncbi:DUF262 domain-containing protein [Herbaspirillum rubrisubalbicans]|uniref:DUF262 domain-containing protein n=1 Tax=Herbaspirillum rubrisubalbicans TaxID=80842 RepID=UPI000370A5AC|nr:DUF262 domain-containing protein [Herbaspirillum rubrisubalbicans]
MTIVENMKTESRPIKWVIDEFGKSNLHVDESFQRNFIWSNRDRIALMETILLGYPIPEIYLWDTGTDPNTGETKFSIVDGQQRIRSINDFIHNQLRLVATSLEFPDQDYQGSTFEKLPDARKSQIWGYPISIRFIGKNATREDIVKMFLRLNRTSNALNPQELRNAEFSGLFLKASERVADIPFWADYAIFSPADLRRMLDIQFASTLLILLRTGFQDETTQAAINRAYDTYNDSYPEAEADISTVGESVDMLRLILEESPQLLEVLRRKTHLYTILSFLFYLRSAGLEIPVKDLAASLTHWYECVEGGAVADFEWGPSIREYKQLSQEGVQKRANRLRRFDILKAYLLRNVKPAKS